MSQQENQGLKKLDLPAVDAGKLRQFITRWQNTEGAGAELADFQSFTLDLCDSLGLPKPNPKSDATKDNAYIFERPVDSFTSDGEKKNSKNRIDLYRRDCFVMEGKQSGKKVGSQGWNNAMQKAKNQADNYLRSLPAEEGRPPFIVVVDVGRSIQLYSEFSRSGGIYVPFPDPGHYQITLENLSKKEIQERLQTLWLFPEALDPGKYAAKVTKEVSVKLAELAKSLEESGYDVDRTAHFLKRCLFTMFSEDVDLIPEGSFTHLLEDLVNTPEHFADSMSALWNTMNEGGFEGQLRKVLPRFNGGLFSDIDPIPLKVEQIQLLVDAAKADWRYVEPAIFGTLLERALDPRERHKLGAHYTPRAYVERLVIPTIVKPLREKWETVKVSVEMLLQENKENKALDALKDFHFKLCNIKVLDPACGSANFLYVALEHLKRLEGEVLNAIRDLSAGQTMMDVDVLTVDPHQFLGIEINPRAAAIAEIVLWIGYLQWHYRIHGALNIPEPILRDFNNIENRDALIAYDSRAPLLDDAGQPITIWDGTSYKTSAANGELIPDELQQVPVYLYDNPRRAQWPTAEYIVGNPPFIGASTMRRALGDGYVDAVRSAFKGDVPDSADFVMYWWHIAAETVRDNKTSTDRFGFITTNSIRQAFNRRVLEPHLNHSKQPLSLEFAIADHPWVDGNDGAAVRIAMTVGVAGEHEGELQQVISENSDGSSGSFVTLMTRKGKIFSDITVGAELTSSAILLANSSISSKGFEAGADGFVVTVEEAVKFDPNVKSNSSEVIRPYLNGKDLINQPKGMWLIDCFGYELEDLQSKFPLLYQHLLETVKPKREQNRDKKLRKYWWLHRRSRADFRTMIKDANSIIATVETSKHRFFTVLDKTVAPSNLLVNIVTDNSAHLGVLSSRIHTLWAFSAGGTLEDRPRYNKGVCFETFPFPVLTDEHSFTIRNLAEKIDAHRKGQQSQHEKLTLTNIYNVLEKLRKEESLSTKEQKVNQQGLVSTLRELHDQLDSAVFAAYSWQDLGNQLVGLPGATTPLLDKSEVQAKVEEELLIRLVELNKQRAAEEIRGKVRWLRPDYQVPDSEQAHIDITSDNVNVDTENKSAVKKITWPKDVHDQINVLLESLTTPTTAESIAERFKRKPLKHVEAVLDALETLGKAQKEEDLWSLT